MNDTSARTPPHLWIVGFLSLMWNGFGAYDYTMTAARDVDYIRQFPPGTMQFLDAMPSWAVALWAIGTWGAVAGSLLLLFRSRLAAPAFIVSLAGLAGSTAHQAMLDMPPEMKTMGMTAMNAVIWVAAVLFLVYALRMRRAGVLR